MKYLAPRGAKKHHHPQQLPQRVNGNNSNKNHSNGFVKHKKRRLRNLAMSVILCLCFVWIYVTSMVFKYIPNTSNRKTVHSISQSQQLRNVHQSNRQYKPTGHQKSDSSDSPYTIVHSLTTRFMLGQKGQPFLARARYLLFETFCQPTVKFQTSNNFSWFVLADPGLDPDILRDLTALLQQFPHQNAYLILTDNPSWAADGVGVPGVHSYGAGLEEIAKAVRDKSVDLLAGDAQRLIRILETDLEQKDGKSSSPPLLLIETMLDADDGLNKKAMEWIQELAIAHTQQQQSLESTSKSSPTLNSTWWLLCGTDHMEWHNRDVYRLTDQQYQRKGLTAGILGKRHAPQYCASAGFTRVGLTTKASSSLPLQFPTIAYSNHALATEQFDRCSAGSEPNKLPNKTATLWSHCFRRDFEGSLLVLKGRTITSDSMDHMGTRTEDYRDLPWETKAEHPLLGLDDQERMWKIAQEEFHISKQAAQTTSVYLREHLAAIIQENKDSRCAPGFPCREVADVAFKKMSKYVNVLEKLNQKQAKQHNEG